MKLEMVVRLAAEGENSTQIPRSRMYAEACVMPDGLQTQVAADGSSLLLMRKSEPDKISSWSGSRAKRLFDCACVLAMLPLLLPMLLIVAVAVWLTSKGPVFFRQQRIGNRGRPFTILKFRTMIHDANAAHRPVTTDGNQPFTVIGPFLRRFKLDELPQIVNVLRGDMSLVGPRPKMPEHVIAAFSCRPGITGAATIAFAREESLLDSIPEHELENFYLRIVLPAKQHLDDEYMSRATFFSDLKLILGSILRRWDDSIAARSLLIERLRSSGRLTESSAAERDSGWVAGAPIRVASISARVDFRRSA